MPKTHKFADLRKTVVADPKRAARVAAMEDELERALDPSEQAEDEAPTPSGGLEPPSPPGEPRG